MARLEGSLTGTAVAVSAATAKTLLQLVAAANQRVALIGYGLGARGTNNLDQPGVIDFIRQTTAGTSAAATPVKTQETLSETLQTAGRDTITGEPTSTDLLRTTTLHPQASLDIKDQFSRELIIGGGNRLGLRVEFLEAQVIDTYLEFEE